MLYAPQFDEEMDDAGNVTLTRLLDGKTVYLQGDDADIFTGAQAKTILNVYPVGPFKCYEQHLDVIIAEYFVED